MVTKNEVIEVLKKVIIPEVLRTPVEMDLVRDISIHDQKVEIKMAVPSISARNQEWLKSRIEGMTGSLAGIEAINVVYDAMKPKDLNRIGHVIAVMSGKGGVGKSLVTGLTALALRRQGYSVGILDADITGPSIPRMFGIRTHASGDENGILPECSESGIRVMSLNLMLPNESESVIWRGPIIGRVITQFWEDVFWGNLDYLIIDLPPGTADAPLTVLQQLPVSGIIIVSSPQDLATMIVKKAVHMAVTMKKRIIGVVENMSYLYVPEIDKKIELFGPSKGEEIARAAGAPLLARLPIDPALAALCDKGEIEAYQSPEVEKFGQALSGIPDIKIDQAS